MRWSQSSMECLISPVMTRMYGSDRTLDGSLVSDIRPSKIAFLNISSSSDYDCPKKSRVRRQRTRFSNMRASTARLSQFPRISNLGRFGNSCSLGFASRWSQNRIGGLRWGREREWGRTWIRSYEVHGRRRSWVWSRRHRCRPPFKPSKL
jgi:hypothetical protein